MDPQTIPFPTIGQVETLRDLFTDLATAIYIHPERKEKLLNNLHQYPKYANFNIRYWTLTTLPTNFKHLILLYFKQPITETDRTEFLDIYMNPFMGTGKQLKELYTTNPALFLPVLDALILSKRIQRIISQPNILYAIEHTFELRKKILLEGALEKYQTEASILRASLLQLYEEQELVIANKFIQAQEKEKQFLASENSMKAKLIANAARRRRKSRRGGKRYTRKVYSLRRR